MMTGIVLENYIRRMTDNGRVIGTVHETVIPVRNGMSHEMWIRNLAKKFLFEIQISPGTPVLARIEWGRWCVCCPHCRQGYEDVSRREKIFFCFSCGWEDKLHPVIFPENADEIEKILLRRHYVRNRNWTDESLSDLMRENILNAEVV